MGPALRPDSVLDERFELQSLVGAGAMGDIFRAHDRRTNETVAIKVLRAASGPALIDRFLREARVLSEIRDPGIVRYVGQGITSQGGHYIVMEWLEGEDLGGLLERSTLSLSQSIALVRRVAMAVAVAHRRGVVHRDIKPDNVFLVGGALDAIKVLDFGVAHVEDTELSLTETGTAIGTPSYMAPEQARGSSTIDARADVFALGCLLHRCIRGRPPFVGADVRAVLAKILFEEAPRIGAGIPRALDELLVRMLAKDPSQRPADAGEVAAALEQLQDAAPEPSSQPESRVLTRQEQRLVSIVLASSGISGGRAPTMSSTEPSGVHFEVLRDGTGLALFEASSDEQIASAAHFALSLRTTDPRACVVLATGRAHVTGDQPRGEVIDRAASLLRMPSDGEPRARVIVDEASAELLEARFVLHREEAGIELLQERERTEETRTLLGRESPFVGRDRELSVLSALCDECREEGVARAILVSAPPGGGKSRLRSEWLRRIRARDPLLPVWMARGEPMSRATPFGTIARLVRAARRTPDDEATWRERLQEDLSRRLGRQDAIRIAELLGDIAGARVEAPQSEELRASRQEPRLLATHVRHAFGEWVGATARHGGLVMVLEDAQWSDDASLELIHFMLGALREAPLLLVVFARSDGLERVRGSLAERAVQHLPLPPLTRRSAEKLARAMLPDQVEEAALARMVENAAGNALHLEELIRAAHRGETMAPGTVLAAMESRLQAVDPESRRVLRAASIFGAAFWAEGLRVLVGGERGPLDARLTGLFEREILTRRAPSRLPPHEELAFRHALLREAAYEALTDDDRRRGHALAAGWLEKQGEHDPMVLAAHWEQGGEPTRAIPWLAAASTNALEANDFRVALERVQRGVSAGAGGGVLGALRVVGAEASYWLGDTAASAQMADEAIELLVPDSPDWHRALGRLAVARARLGQQDTLPTLIARLRPLGRRDPWHVRTAIRMAIAALTVSRVADAREILQAVSEVAQDLARSDLLVEASLEQARSFLANEDGMPGACIEHGLRSADDHARAGDLRAAIVLRSNAGSTQIEIGQNEAAARTLRACIEEGTRIGAADIVVFARTYLCHALLQSGDVAGALTEVQSTVERLGPDGDPWLVYVARTALTRVLLDAGRPADAIAALDLSKTGVTGWPRAFALATLADAHLALGDTTRALELVEEARRLRVGDAAVLFNDVEVLLVHGCVLDALGRSNEARAAVSQACDVILRRLRGVGDAEQRRVALTQVPLHRRTLATARNWGIAIPSALAL